MLDSVDLEILRLLQDNARISNAAIARHVKLAPSAVLKRIRRLEDEKVIIGYETRIDRHKVGMGMSSYILIETGEQPGTIEIGKKIAELPEVQDVHFTSGSFYYMAKVKTRDSNEHNELEKKLGKIGVKIAGPP